MALFATTLRWITVLATALCMFALLGQFSDSANLINVLVPLLLAIAAAGSLLLFVVRKWRVPALLWPVAISLVVGGVVPLLRATSRITPRAPIAAQSDDIRIVSINLWKKNRNPARTAAWIRNQRPDIAVISEAGGSSAAVPAMLKDILPFQYSCHRRAYCSTMILSKFRPLSVEPLARGDPENRKTLSALVVRFDDRWDGLILIGAHLGHPWPFGRQREDVSALIAAAAREPAEKIVVIGDLNATPWSFALADITEGIGLSRATRWVTSWPTAEADLPLPALLPIDHALLGTHWTAQIERGPSIGSDHYPLTAILKRVLGTGRQSVTYNRQGLE